MQQFGGGKEYQEFLCTSLKQQLYKGNYHFAKKKTKKNPTPQKPQQAFIKNQALRAWLNVLPCSLTFPRVRKAITATPSRRFSHGLFSSIYSIRILTDATANKADSEIRPSSSLRSLASAVPSGHRGENDVQHHEASSLPPAQPGTQRTFPLCPNQQQPAG